MAAAETPAHRESPLTRDLRRFRVCMGVIPLAFIAGRIHLRVRMPER